MKRSYLGEKICTDLVSLSDRFIGQILDSLVAIAVMCLSSTGN